MSSNVCVVPSLYRIYASSREAVVGVMPVQRSIQATEKDELAYPDVKNAVFSG